MKHCRAFSHYGIEVSEGGEVALPVGRKVAYLAFYKRELSKLKLGGDKL